MTLLWLDNLLKVLMMKSPRWEALINLQLAMMQLNFLCSGARYCFFFFLAVNMPYLLKSFFCGDGRLNLLLLIHILTYMGRFFYAPDPFIGLLLLKRL